MAHIEGIRIRNFRALRDVTLGKLWNLQHAASLTPMTAVIGKNGVGKSSLFDAFGFLSDCLRSGVEEACDLRGRGGFDRIRSQGQEGPIEFDVYYKEDGNARPITFEIAVGLDSGGRPYVQKERLRQRRKGQKHGWPFSFHGHPAHETTSRKPVLRCHIAAQTHPHRSKRIAHRPKMAC